MAATHADRARAPRPKPGRGHATVDATSRTRNPKGEGGRLREDLVEAAAQMIAETGDAGQLTLRGVARRVGIAAPSIYRHFPDVDHLKMAVVDRAFGQFAAERD